MYFPSELLYVQLAWLGGYDGDQAESGGAQSERSMLFWCGTEYLLFLKDSPPDHNPNGGTFSVPR